MIEIAANVFVERGWAERNGMTRYATGGIVGLGKPYLVGEHCSDYPLPKAVAERLGLLR
ncbi:hypothetical protein [Microvirga mediterraneensis]|uniref:Uncharacterized protein n=1 Tax=Microvirga mediterraneensis TaxID=2754695 RepID=A0A838BS20_9HYPH|nr:hypothetical protein [Microvirga mediterraneensis]MBA1157775.1 hypothetical protein [Microvirga mediterraneensis]